MKRFVLLSLTLVATLVLSAQTAREEVDANPQVVIPTMTVYSGELFPVEAPAVPKGFKPVFIAGYLRHGSRLEALEEYPIDAYNYFKKADEHSEAFKFKKEAETSLSEDKIVEEFSSEDKDD